MAFLSFNGQILKDLNIFVDGVGNLGRAKSVKLPKVEFKKEEQDLGGMAGPVDVETNLDKLEAEFSTADLDPDKMSLMGLSYPNTPIITFRKALKDGAVEIPVVATIGGSLTVEPDTEKGKTVESKFKIAVTYYNLNIGGQQVYLIDKLNNIVVIGTRDLNAATRAIIG